MERCLLLLRGAGLLWLFRAVPEILMVSRLSVDACLGCTSLEVGDARDGDLPYFPYAG